LFENRERLPLVGRQRELATFEAYLEAAQEGRGGIMFVAGEPGIGKTRLLVEIGRLARARGWEVLSGRAYDSEGVPPYLPFVEALRDYVRRCSLDELRAQLGESAPEVARVVAEVPRRLPDLPQSRVMDPELDRYRLFEGITEFLLAIAHATAGLGLLVVLDDLHWADKASLLLLQHLAHRVSGARLLIAGSYRTVELNRTHPLAAVLADLRRDGISERLLLPPLFAHEVGVLVEAMAGARPAADVVDLIVRQTDGNPFFVRELTLHLQAEGILQQDQRATGAPVPWSIPEGVREVIDRRLVQLGSEANQMLQAAAVLGSGFSFGVLQAMSGIEAAGLLDAIDEAVAAGILREDGEGYDFGHALIRETLYSKLTLARRQHLHLRAALVLEAVRSDAPAPPLGEIADHYRLAGPLADPEKAIDVAVRAGQAAVDVFAYEEALGHWKAGLELMKQHAAGPEQCVSMVERLASLASTIGFDHSLESASYWEEALQLCERHGLVQRGAYVRCRLGGMRASNLATMDIPGAMAHLRTAESILKLHPDPESLGHLYGGLGSAGVWAARTEEGLSASQRGMDFGQQSGDGTIWPYSAINHAWHLVSLGYLADGLGLHQRAWETADRVDRTFVAYRATSFMGNRYFLLDDPNAAATCYERELSEPRLAASRTRRLALISSLAAVYARTGNLAEARRLVIQLGAETFNQDSAMLAQPLVAFWSGDLDAAFEAWTAARERHRRVGNRWGVADFGCWLGELLYVRGDGAGAARLFEESLSIAIDAPIVPLELKTRAALAILTAKQGMLHNARAHITRCAEILANGEDWRGLTGRVAIAEAVVAATEGDVDRAATRFTDATHVFERYGLRWEAAEVLHMWGRALAHAGDVAEAIDKVDAAVEIYQTCGAGAVWIERVLRARPRGSGRHVSHSRRPAVVRPHTYPDGLSEREVQVVRLIAGGKSNREIAEALVISRNTVERHVNHILAKTGASNRTQVAGYAHRHKLEA